MFEEVAEELCKTNIEAFKKAFSNALFDEFSFQVYETKTSQY